MKITNSLVSAEKVSQESFVRPTLMTVLPCHVLMEAPAVMKLGTSVVNALLGGLAQDAKVTLEPAKTCRAKTAPSVSTSSRTSSVCKYNFSHYCDSLLTCN